MKRPIALLALAVSAATAACGGGSSPGATARDAASDGDAGDPCTVTDAGAICHGHVASIVSSDADTRQVYWVESPAASGDRPAVILYQGTGFGPSLTWNTEVPASAAFGGYYQLVLVSTLLDSGFTMIQPSAQSGVAWDTNTPGRDYDASADAVFIPRLLDEIARGTFGHVDMARLYATGISSGGYMTSRMAVSYPGRFRALAIESGSYATCLGPLCSIPSSLPSDHPPTLFLHGGADSIVPLSTAQAYYDRLVADGIEAKFVEEADAGHQWIAAAPDEIRRWFSAH